MNSGNQLLEVKSTSEEAIPSLEISHDTFSCWKEILVTYSHYQTHGAGFIGFWKRCFYGYAYHGNSPSAYRNFIKLIDRFALMDSEGHWITSLIEILNDIENHQEAQNNKTKFFNRIYAIFASWQNDYFNHRRMQNAYFKRNIKRFPRYSNLRSNQAWFDEYFDYIVYEKENTSNANVPENIQHCLGKITYDLKQLKDEIKEEDENFLKQAALFKKTIHHVAEDYHFASKIKKRAATPAQPSIYYVDNEASFHECPIEKIQKRWLQTILEILASVGSAICSVGEGFVAVSGATSLIPICPLLAAIGIVGTAGWYINRLLFKDDSENVLKSLFIKKEIICDGERQKHRLIFLIKDPDGTYRPISKTKKNIICVVGTLSIFTGIVNGALNFVCTSSYIHSSHAILSVLCLTTAGFPPTFLVFAISGIFFKVIADFIKNDRHKDIIAYFKRTFLTAPSTEIDPNTNTRLLSNGMDHNAKARLPWNEMDSSEKAKHIGKCALKATICLAAVTITAIVTVASFGVLYNSSLSILSSMVNANPMPYIARALTWISNAISIPFQLDTSCKVLQSCISNERHTFSGSIKTLKNAKPTNALQKSAIRLQTMSTVIALGTNGINVFGQVGVNLSSPLLRLSTNARVDGVLKGAATAFYSGLPNASAAKEYIHKRQILPKIISPLEKKSSQQSQSESFLRSQARTALFKKLAFSCNENITKTQLLTRGYRSR